MVGAFSGALDESTAPGSVAGSGPATESPADGQWAGALIAAVIATELPGPGSTFVRQTLSFARPAMAGEQVTARVKVRDKSPDTRRVTLDCVCVGSSGEVLVTGDVEVTAPATKIRRPRVAGPDLELHEPGLRYRQLVDAARRWDPIRVAVVHPCDAVSIAGALGARDARLIVPILIGPAVKIRKAAVDARCDLQGVEIVDVPHSHAAAERAVQLARESKVDALMKGALHTDELMAAVVDKGAGLRTDRRMSHVFALDVPHYPKPLFITDAAINIAPDLDAKRDIVQNAIELAHALAIEVPKVAILAAVETVDAKMPSTLDAAALCKMAERKQIVGGLLDGPLAFDNAVSADAARTKDISSPVAGDADILVAPDLEAGNLLAKQLIYLAGADAAGIVLGARLPIVLTSRADGELARLASCALTLLLVRRGLRGP
jgi:phosphotransacetylase